MQKRNILIVGIAAGISVAGFLLLGSLQSELGFPLDDAWIHQTYARNIAEFGEWSFVLGQPSAGLTAPLWAVLLLPGYWIGWAPFGWTLFLGWLNLWLVGLVGMIGLEKLVPDKPRWVLGGGVLLVFEWHLVWAALSGMETLLFGLIVLWILIKLFDEDISNIVALKIGGVIGLSVWVRPEGITLLGPLLLLVFVKEEWKYRLQKIGMAVLGFATLFLPYLLFNLWLAGEVWPNTFFAKQAEYVIYQETPLINRLGQQFFQPLIGVGIILLPGFIAQVTRFWKDRKLSGLLVSAWVIGHMALYALRLPVVYQHGRYVIPAMPVFFVLGVAGVGLVAKPDHTRVMERIQGRVWLLLIPTVLIMFWILGGNGYAKDVAVINEEMVAMAKWVKENTDENDLIAAHDIGALGYFAQRPLLDLAGLVSPDVIPFIRDEEALTDYLNEEQPAYLVTFPGWYPKLVKNGEKVFEIEGKASIEQGGENMVIYRWKRE